MSGRSPLPSSTSFLILLLILKISSPLPLLIFASTDIYIPVCKQLSHREGTLTGISLLSVPQMLPPLGLSHIFILAVRAAIFSHICKLGSRSSIWFTLCCAESFIECFLLWKDMSFGRPSWHSVLFLGVLTGLEAFVCTISKGNSWVHTNQKAFLSIILGLKAGVRWFSALGILPWNFINTDKLDHYVQ